MWLRSIYCWLICSWVQCLCIKFGHICTLFWGEKHLLCYWILIFTFNFRTFCLSWSTFSCWFHMSAFLFKSFNTLAFIWWFFCLLETFKFLESVSEENSCGCKCFKQNIFLLTLINEIGKHLFFLPIIICFVLWNKGRKCFFVLLFIWSIS